MLRKKQYNINWMFALQKCITIRLFILEEIASRTYFILISPLQAIAQLWMERRTLRLTAEVAPRCSTHACPCRQEMAPVTRTRTVATMSRVVLWRIDSSASRVCFKTTILYLHVLVILCSVTWLRLKPGTANCGYSEQVYFQWRKCSENVQQQTYKLLNICWK